MGSKFPAVIPSAIASAFLLIGAAPIHAYGYYIFLRWAVCAAAVWFCYSAVNVKRGWLLIVGVPLAILFNPIVPIYMHKATWSIIDLAAVAVLFGFSWVIRSTPKANQTVQGQQ
jgi:hypothetical protein